MEFRIVKMIASVALWMGLTAGLRAQTVVEYIHTDALGTPVAVTNAAGTVIERSVYEPYGQLINRPLTDGPGFTGHVQDAATGLTYMQQRYYDPGIGRFLSVDPITADGNTGANFNRYAYANNNPYRFTDPDGRQAMGSPNDMANPVTIEQSADVLGWVSDGLEALDQVFMSNPYASLGRVATVPLARMAKPLAAEAKAGAKAARLAANQAKGAAGEAATRAKLGNKVAGEQVTFRTSDGTRTRADFVTKDGGVVETKTGGAQLSPGQTKLKADIDAGRQVTPVGNNATKAGLPAGQPATMKSCTVDRPGC